ncbi:MAG: BrnT family toxin [Campylobacterales bacterium]
MRLEWCDEKNQSNIKKHHVSFEEAKEVFLDPMHISKLDYRFDFFEERWITLGATSEDKILVVANMFFDDDGNEIIRIISARKANQKERIFYEQH